MVRKEIKTSRREFLKLIGAGVTAFTLGSIFDSKQAQADGPEFVPGKNIDQARPLILGTTYWELKNSYFEPKGLFFKLEDLNPSHPTKPTNHYEIDVFVPAGDHSWNRRLPSLDHFSARFYSWDQIGAIRQGDYANPKAVASLQPPKDKNFNGGNLVLHADACQPVYNEKGVLMPWYMILSYSANPSETDLKNIQYDFWSFWLQPDFRLPDTAPIAVRAATK